MRHFRRSLTRFRKSARLRSDVQRRRLVTESLEQRHLLAAAPFQNDIIHADTNMDGDVTPYDAHALITFLNQHGAKSTDEVAAMGITDSMLNVNGDEYVSAADANMTITELNRKAAEGEGELVAFTIGLKRPDGTVINPGASISEGSHIVATVSVQDLRAAGDDNGQPGVFAAYVDFLYDTAGLQIDMREVQTLLFTGNPADGSEYTLSFMGMTTAPIEFSNNSFFPAATNDALNFQRLQQAVDTTFGEGNIEISPTLNTNSSFDIRFSNIYANTDVPLMTVNTSGFTSGTGTITDSSGIDPNNPDDFRGSISFDAFVYHNGTTASNNVGEIDEVGGFDGTSPLDHNAKPVFKVHFSTIASGTATLTLGQADESASDVLLFGVDDPVPKSMIDYGSPFSINIVSDVAATDDTATVAEDSGTVSIPVLDNDEVFSGGSLSILSRTVPSNGTATISGSNIVYSPNNNYFGQDTFTYTVTDGLGATDTATVTVTVTPMNDPPTAGPDSFSAVENTPKVFDLETITATLLSNDTRGPANESGQTLTIIGFTSPGSRGGTVVVNDMGTATTSDDTLTYTPPANTIGTETFTYTIRDNGLTGETAMPLTAVGTVTVTIVDQPDAPVAVDDDRSTNEDAPLTIDVLSNDTDPDDGDTLSIMSVDTTGTQGTVTFGATVSYTPPANFFGTDTFQYTVEDSFDLTDTATVTITVNPINDAPVATNDTYDGILGFSADNLLNVLENDNPGPLESSVDTITIMDVSGPATGGTAVIDNNQISYTPPPNSPGPLTETFTYTIEDSAGLTDTATVTVNVVPPVRPFAARDTATLAEDSGANTINVLINDLQTEDGMISITSTTDGQNGTVAITNNGQAVTYTPNLNFFGSDTFTYTITDTGTIDNNGPSTGTVTVTVSPVNDGPTADPDSATVPEDAEDFVVNALVNDSPGPNEGSVDNIRVLTTGTPSHGTARPNPDSSAVLYTPNKDYFGNDSFTYTIIDDDGLTTTATITIDVTNINDNPTVVNDTATVNEDSMNNQIFVLANDKSDPDPAELLSVTNVSTPANGTAVVAGGNSIVEYTPNHDFFGMDSFTYTVTDGNGGSSTGSVTVTVNNVNDPPTANNDSGAGFRVIRNTGPATLNLLANDYVGRDRGAT